MIYRFNRWRRGLIRGTKNFFKWGWRCRDIHWWDYSYFLELQQMWLEESSRMHKDYGITTESEQTAKEMKICVELLERIRTDQDYSFTKQNGDLDYLFSIYKKRLFRWWD